jgi:hypothetical protein
MVMDLWSIVVNFSSSLLNAADNSLTICDFRSKIAYLKRSGSMSPCMIVSELSTERMVNVPKMRQRRLEVKCLCTQGCTAESPWKMYIYIKI